MFSNISILFFFRSYPAVRTLIYTLSFFPPPALFFCQVSINLGNCVFKWQDKGKISEHDPNLNRLSSPADTNVGTKTRVVLMLSQLSSLLFENRFFFSFPTFYEVVKKKKRFKIPSEVHIKLLLVCDDKKKKKKWLKQTSWIQ